MNRNLIWLLVLLISFSAMARQEGSSKSAYRDPKLPSSFYINNIIPSDKNTLLRQTAYGAARSYTGENLPSATEMSQDQMIGAFETIRDSRSFTWSGDPGFPRRISWLYPVDGCYHRAMLANSLLKKSGFVTPNNVFAFGELATDTQNSTTGVVTWWYHTAPIVQVGLVKYVLDPAIDPEKPLTLENWLAKMGKPKKMKVSICGAGADAPETNCANKETYEPHVKTQNYFFIEEWNLQKKIGKDPEVVLGNNPPWDEN